MQLRSQSLFLLNVPSFLSTSAVYGPKISLVCIEVLNSTLKREASDGHSLSQQQTQQHQPP